jgi:NAD(P)H-dependent FMN reductase/sugar phosphate isomerase/epimerase
MITLIVGTNRPDSRTIRVARQIEALYLDLGVPLQVVDLSLLPLDCFAPSAYAAKPPSFAPFSEAILNSSGLVLVVPEYNGSFPGVLKYFIDLCKYPESLEGRPVCFVGLADGQFGALRAVEQLQQICGYRNAYSYPKRVFLPEIDTLLDAAGHIKDPEIQRRLRAQAEGFVEFVELVKGAKLSGAGVAPALRKNLAVCSWSLQPDSPQALVKKLKEIGCSRVQLALDPLRDNPKVWGKTAELFKKEKIEIVSGMFGCVGEDYSTLETIRHTGGLVPDKTWKQNWINIGQSAELAAKLGLKSVTFHAGFLPHDKDDPDFAKLAARLRRVADLFAVKGIDLAFETGQESAGILREFLTQLNCPNVGVNFDPANMILYDKGNPIFALRVLAPWVKSCHLKDANRTKQPGTWGEEVPLGTGEVNWRAFFQTLAELNFAGNLCIEREAGTERVADIKTARKLVQTLK